MTTKFKAGDKVRCVEGSSSERYGNLVTGTVYTVDLGQEDTHTKECIKVEGLVSHYDVCRFELIQRFFDIHKDKWFIRTPTKEACEAAQKWLFEQGVSWIYNDGKVIDVSPQSLGCTQIHGTGKFTHSPVWDYESKGCKEIVLTFKTVVDTVEYPTIVQEALVTQEQSEAQKQVDILEQKIKELQDQLEVVKEEIK